MATCYGAKAACLQNNKRHLVFISIRLKCMYIYIYILFLYIYIYLRNNIDSRCASLGVAANGIFL